MLFYNYATIEGRSLLIRQKEVRFSHEKESSEAANNKVRFDLHNRSIKGDVK